MQSDHIIISHIKILKTSSSACPNIDLDEVVARELLVMHWYRLLSTVARQPDGFFVSYVAREPSARSLV